MVMAIIWAFGGTFTVLIAWGCIPAWLYGWRVLIAVCTSPILIFLCTSFWVPESMLFLVRKGKVEEAMQSYRNASDCHIADDSQSASNKVLLEVAFHAAATGDYEMAIQYYEQNARDGVDNQLIRWSVKNYLFSASLCQLCLAAQNNSLEQAKEAHDR